jgi:hypothetical protein
VSGWFSEQVVQTGRLPLFCFFVAFISGFAGIRVSVRMIRAGVRWWPGNLVAGAVHVHHMVFGVVLMAAGGIAGLAAPPFSLAWRASAAGVFGLGTALVLDEFALILHLQDVYWSEDGRTSVDAVFAAIAVAGLLILGFNPLSFFDIDIWREDQTLLARATVVGIALITLLLAVMVLLKGKVWTGLIGMFITPLLLIGAGRLSRPHAPWARWRYGKRPKKMHRALERERRQRRPVVQAKLWLQHVVAGEPHFPDDHEVNAQLDREVHPAPAPAPVAATTEAV